MILGYWPEAAIYWPWDVWIVTWLVAALWTNRTVKRISIGQEWPYRLVTLMGFICILYFSQNSGDFAKGIPARNIVAQRFWALPPVAGWAMVALAFLGFLFAWWARVHLGRMWSGTITRKTDHRVVDSGPYALVRHPIYTGIILAGFATAAEKGTTIAVLGALLLVIGYWMKAKLEERFLREELGAEAYDSYRRRVPMLFPFGPKAT
ncbi:MAG: isoprenylcysteine carboxylmethyltransferase family protein [Proteobacteria bacterium]|nr:isoprenylcysteine carboxylmethyltransferase family protein [Pseudomonadota bacterium]